MPNSDTRRSYTNQNIEFWDLEIMCPRGGGLRHIFLSKIGFLPKKCKKIGFKLDKMCHMGAHTFILYSNLKIYPKSMFMRHT